MNDARKLYFSSVHVLGKLTVTLEELAISSMWEMAALVEVLEKKGLLTKQDILDAIRELRRKNPQARTPLEVDDHPDPAFPDGFSPPAEPSVAQAESALIERILELILATKLSAPQAKVLLDRVRQAIEWGERMNKKTTH